MRDVAGLYLLDCEDGYPAAQHHAKITSDPEVHSRAGDGQIGGAGATSVASVAP
jgi:hypothetical protein